MEDKFVLLKIKREFTSNEAVQSLLKMVSALEYENGVLKSDIADLEFKINKLRGGQGKSERKWLQDEIFKKVKSELTLLKQDNMLHKKSMVEWRQKYFSLMAQKQPNN
jgi:hypothetical protein